MASLLENEKKNVERMMRKLDQKLEKMEGVRMNVNDGKSLIMTAEEMKKEGIFEDSDSQQRESLFPSSKISFKSEDFSQFGTENLMDSIKKNPQASLCAIKEEESPGKIANNNGNVYKFDEEINNNKNEKANLEEKNNEKIKELQQALSISLQKIRHDDYNVSKVENTIYESFEQHNSPEREKEDANKIENENRAQENLLKILKTEEKHEEYSSSDSSQIEEDPGSPIPILKNCDSIKKVKITINFH